MISSSTTPSFALHRPRTRSLRLASLRLSQSLAVERRTALTTEWSEGTRRNIVCGTNITSTQRRPFETRIEIAWRVTATSTKSPGRITLAVSRVTRPSAC
ncbi:hypothetical protein BV20DRAFT_576974 [Pilatotrama ljubarskyi]|nr:hypothetical protein BV20DRAFT_576974 [Pilatotrama ljubarskyi]